MREPGILFSDTSIPGGLFTQVCWHVGDFSEDRTERDRHHRNPRPSYSTCGYTGPDPNFTRRDDRESLEMGWVRMPAEVGASILPTFATCHPSLNFAVLLPLLPSVSILPLGRSGRNLARLAEIVRNVFSAPATLSIPDP